MGIAPRVNVEFEGGVQGLQRGDQVYMFGVSIGETGDPFVAGNRAIVPVVLKSGSTFDQNAQVLFFIAADQARPTHQCLIARIHSVPAEAGRPRFRGFASELNLNVQMGAEQLEWWWKSHRRN